MKESGATTVVDIRDFTPIRKGRIPSGMLSALELGVFEK
jgi:hypothetical protein